ncbi:AAA family ATPase [Sphaerisporangium viridialbum]|uniref:AAA family ATPase n=1 Tax=Sphaerisporangium viridialbum TaxID=46189 RepID=UPI003C75C290
MNASLRLRPAGGHDLRKHHVAELCYPRECVLVVAGIPGAGKTTLLRRLFAVTGQESTTARTDDGTLVLDSAQARTWWRRYLHRLPYAWWRPLIHLTYYGRLVLTMRAHNGPVVLHDCATSPWNRRLIMNAARRARKQVHLLMLDVAPPTARAAQHARGRRVPASSFARHCDRWQRMRDAVLDGPGAVHPDITSAVIINRAGAQRLTTIHFQESP